MGESILNKFKVMSCKLMTTTLKFLNLLLAGKTTEKGEEIYP